MKTWLAFALSVSVAACSAPVENDASTGDASDIATGDAIADATADAVEASVDARDATSENANDVSNDGPTDASLDDVVIDPGMCGQGVRDCLCGCGADATCQSGCITTAPDDCQFCFYTAAMNCCPAEESAYGMCIDQHMCTDQACVDMNCAAQESAFNTCFQRRQTSVPSCTMEVQTCLGSDYPMIRCVMTR